MPQYTTISAGSPLNISDGIDSFRYIAIGGVLHLRQTKTETGFAGDEGTDWGDIEEYADLGGGIWRVGVRTLKWRIDCTINATGFMGEENTDWGNYEGHKL